MMSFKTQQEYWEYIASEEEEKEWKELEKKLDAKTIDCRVPIEEKRKWFRETFDYCADDESVEMKWRKHHD